MDPAVWSCLRWPHEEIDKKKKNGSTMNIEPTKQTIKLASGGNLRSGHRITQNIHNMDTMAEHMYVCVCVCVCVFVCVCVCVSECVCVCVCVCE